MAMGQVLRSKWGAALDKRMKRLGIEQPETCALTKCVGDEDACWFTLRLVNNDPVATAGATSIMVEFAYVHGITGAVKHMDRASGKWIVEAVAVPVINK